MKNYFIGIAGIVWCVAWFFLTADTPHDHKFIKDNEKNYIGRQIKHHKLVRMNQLNFYKAIYFIFLLVIQGRTPWLSIMRSKACIALFIGHATSNWGTYLFLTNIPTYMSEVLKFDIKSVIIFYKFKITI